MDIFIQTFQQLKKILIRNSFPYSRNGGEGGDDRECRGGKFEYDIFNIL
jgi:hypothetical protein